MNEARELRLAAFNAVTQRYAALDYSTRSSVTAEGIKGPSLHQHLADAEEVEKWLLRVGGDVKKIPVDIISKAFANVDKVRR